MKIPAFLHRFASPKLFHERAGSLVPWLVAGFLATTIAGIYHGLWVAPPDYEQGESYRIIYVHVPAAWLSMFVYAVMAVASAIFLIWRIKLADIVALVSAPLGAAFTALALATGSIWGKPMWGTWWQWDARLTSELILLFLYLGYMALRAAIEDRQASSRAGAVLALVGVVNIPIIHYSVEWWNTLHQGSTITRFGKPSMAPEMLLPLLLMAVAYQLLYFAAVLIAGRAENLAREARSQWPQQASRLRLTIGPILLVMASVFYVGWHTAQSHAVQDTDRVVLQGSVQDLQKQADIIQFSLVQNQQKTPVRFHGSVSRYLNEGGGAEVHGQLQDGTLIASRVIGMNLKRYDNYLFASFALAALAGLYILLAPLLQERKAWREVKLRSRLQNHR